MRAGIRISSVVWVAPVLVSAAWAPAGSSIPNDALQQLKRATVFVKVTRGGRPEATGSGFLVYRHGKMGLIATSAHVLKKRPGAELQITVVFDSGTRREESQIATVAGVDTKRDVTLLRAEKTQLPAPIRLSPRAKPRETLPVHILGFPFGKALSAREGNPEVTVANGTISSLRKDSAGNISYIQLDGDLNPGNSGGPVVDERGALVGVAKATIMGTQISMAVPPEVLEELMRGRVRQTTLTEVMNKNGRVRLEVTAQLADPTKTIKRASILLGRKDEIQEPPARDAFGQFAALPKSAEYRLAVADDTATGSIPLRGKRPDEDCIVYLMQTKCVRRDNTVIYTQPRELDITFERETATEKPTPGEAEGVEEPQDDAAGPAADQPVPEARDAVTEMPGTIQDVAVAGSGQYIVMRLRDVPGLAVYDAFRAEIAEIIRLPSTDFVFAAGGDTAVIFFNENNVLQSWDLTTFQKKKAKASPVSGTIKGIVMGHSRGDQAFVRYAEGHGGAGFLLETATLRPVTIDGEILYIRGSHGFSRHNMQCRSDGYLNHLTAWAVGVSPSGINIFTRGGRRFEHKREHSSAGNLAMGDDGRIYSSTGTIFTSDLVKCGQLRGHSFFPGIGGSFFLGLDEGGTITVYEAGKTTPICKWGNFPGWRNDRSGSRSWRHSRDGIPYDKRIVFIPFHNRIVFFPPENDRVILQRFDLEATLQQAGVDYLFVTSVPERHALPGQEWSYQVKAMSGAGDVQFRLELAPDGMQIAPDGLMTWHAPKDVGQSKEKVVLLITDGAGEQTYHSFWLEVATKDRTSGHGIGGTAAAGRVHRFDYSTD